MSAMSAFTTGTAVRATVAGPVARRAQVVVNAGKYDAELIATAKAICTPGKGILAMDESNGTCGKRLESIGVANTEENRRDYRELLISAPGIGEYCGGAILFEETLYQKTASGERMVDVMAKQGIVVGIKVDKGLVPMTNANAGETWCQGLDGLAERCAEYYKAGARFCNWRTTVNITAGPSEIALNDAAYGLARYGAIAQEAGLVPIIEPEILLDGDHDIDTTLAVAERTWAATFKHMADQGVLFEGILLKPSMVTPGAEAKNRPDAATIAEYTLKMLSRRVPPAVPGIMFLSGGQSELESTLNLNAMNQSPNPWHVSFSYARALQNTCLKAWQGKKENVAAAQAALLVRARANSAAQKGEYTSALETDAGSAGEGMFVKNYSY
jgi:fructose-bisphosphate aldolase class I